MRGIGSSYALQTINIESVEQYIGGGALAAILRDGEKLRVSDIESVSAGGIAVNVTDSVHESWVNMATHITESLKLFVAGFDIMTEDISLPMNGNYVPLLEVNSRPGLKIHEYPSVGNPVQIAPMLLDAVFKSE